MSKRAGQIGVRHDPHPKDAYDTPPEVVQPLLRSLGNRLAFVEPCAGAGKLVDALEAGGHVCLAAFDIEPRSPRVDQFDGASIGPGGELVITNPPFSKARLLPLLDAWIGFGREMCLLLPTDTLFNAYFSPYAPLVGNILPIGRVRWFEGTSGTSTDNFAWVQINGAERGLLRGRA